MSVPGEIDRYFEMSDEELKNNLTSLLNDIDDVEALVEQRSEDVPRLLSRLDGTDVEEFANDAPEVAEEFQDFLWDATSALVDRDEELQENITQNATVNFEADDSPMRGHLRVEDEAGTLEGGAGHVDGADLHITGPSNTLAGMLTGSTDPVQGFMAGEFEMDGDVDTGMELASVMTPVHERLNKYADEEATD
ncbi:SCP2 sterol-binding domain-containing protein [Haladaptatus sp. F3-133]|uniref:SCP2 sterol-binding domain-containing protein n=1 Tax=Halorutilus salinus TaxID=2487751 RepID=A0A9Q4C4I9_9EURY|nr:SCP2 sterol-binding domain-containing protein [Halorutilus salinus]MCX2818191.1 SCP2 sterol-binding domain-containing protein [Halorutilus salinus]